MVIYVLLLFTYYDSTRFIIAEDHSGCKQLRYIIFATFGCILGCSDDFLMVLELFYKKLYIFRKVSFTYSQLVFYHFRQLRHVILAPLSIEKCKICTFFHHKVQILHFYLFSIISTDKSVQACKYRISLPEFKQKRQQRRHVTKRTFQTISQFTLLFLYRQRQLLQGLLRLLR